MIYILHRRGAEEQRRRIVSSEQKRTNAVGRSVAGEHGILQLTADMGDKRKELFAFPPLIMQ
jgi:hypothetical protein